VAKNVLNYLKLNFMEFVFAFVLSDQSQCTVCDFHHMKHGWCGWTCAVYYVLCTIKTLAGD